MFSSGAVFYGGEQENTAATPSPLLETVHGIFLIIQCPATVLRMNKLVISLG